MANQFLSFKAFFFIFFSLLSFVQTLNSSKVRIWLLIGACQPEYQRFYISLPMKPAEVIDDSPVKPSGRPQSIGLEDGFKKVSLVDEVECRLNVLLRRLCESAQEDGRIPLCLKLTVRKQDGGYSTGKRESRQCS